MIKRASALKGARDIKRISRGARRQGPGTSILYSAELFILGKSKERLEAENAYLEKRMAANRKKIGAIKEKMARFAGETRTVADQKDEMEMSGMKCKKMTLGY